MDWEHEDSENGLTWLKRDHDVNKDSLYRPVVELCSRKSRERTLTNINNKNIKHKSELLFLVRRMGLEGNCTHLQFTPSGMYINQTLWGILQNKWKVTPVLGGLRESVKCFVFMFWPAFRSILRSQWTLSTFTANGEFSSVIYTEFSLEAWKSILPRLIRFGL